MKTIFTGQAVVGTDPHDPRSPYDLVECQACKQPVSLRTAYIDRYTDAAPTEKYVHYKCLSAKRQQEIANEAARSFLP